MGKSFLTFSEAQALVVNVLTGCSVDLPDAQTIATHLVDSEARGYSSHGLVRLLPMIEAIKSSPAAEQRQASVDTGPFILLSGGGSQGIAAVTDLLDQAANRAIKHGAVVVGVTNYVGTTGCLGVYAASLAARGLVAIQFCHSEYGVAPYGAAEAILGTNPVAVSMPGRNFPFIADFATAAWSYGSLKSAMAEGRSVPLGVVQTENGDPSTDPNDADKGSQLPMAGHKGYALGLAIELICGPLLGGKAGHKAVLGSDSYFAVLLRSDIARPSSIVEDETERLYQEIRSAPLAKGFEKVRIPGERSNRASVDSHRVGISEDLLQKLMMLRTAP